MTNEQLVLSAEEKIEELKKKYMDVLQPLAIALKWSNPTGHLVKVVKLPTEVKHDKQTDTTPVHAGI